MTDSDWSEQARAISIARAADRALEAEQRLATVDGPALIAGALDYIADTQATLSRLSGITPNTITALKRGKRPTAAQRAAIFWAIFRRWS